MKRYVLLCFVLLAFLLSGCTSQPQFPVSSELDLDALQKKMEVMMEKFRYEEFEALYFSILQKTDGPGSPDFAAQPASVRAAYVVALMDMEILNGGIAQFFYNCGSEFAALVPDALREVGFHDIAALYERFLAEQHITLSEIDSYRAAYPDFVGVYQAHPFDDFDNAYMSIWENTNFNVRMLEYAAAHPELY